MKYTDIRDKIKSGDLLAWTHRSWKTWYDIKVQIVRMFTRSEYCHCGVAWVIAGRVFVLESVVPKVRIVPLSNELPFYWIPMGAPWNSETEEFALSLVGKGDYSQVEAVIAGMGGRTPTTNGLWQCAKYVNAVLALDGFDFETIKDTPTATVQRALELNKTLQLIGE